MTCHHLLYKSPTAPRLHCKISRARTVPTMPRPLQFSEIYTHRGCKELLLGDSGRWSVSEIARYLGLDSKHAQTTQRTPITVRAFIKELRRTTSDLLDVAGITGKPGDRTFTPTSLVANVAFIGIACTISQEYGPSLWGRDRREHLVWPRDVEGFRGLYWDRKRDADLYVDPVSPRRINVFI